MEDGEAREPSEQEGIPADLPAVEEAVLAATRLLLGTAGLAVASARRWERGSAGEDDRSTGASTLASAALGLGLLTERAVVRGSVAVGATAASLTWGIVHATPFRGPVERLAERFRTERQVSEQGVSDGVAGLLEALSEAVLVRVDLDRVIDRIALERVLARVDRRELAERLEVLDDAPETATGSTTG